MLKCPENKNQLFSLILLLSILSCNKHSTRMEQNWVQDSKSTEVHPLGDNFDWGKNTPFDFLIMLETHQGVFTVAGYHKNWIKENDIPGLIKLLDSKTPCAPVVSALSSFYPIRIRSFVGIEA
jgi:hypothetical protein